MFVLLVAIPPTAAAGAAAVVAEVSGVRAARMSSGGAGAVSYQVTYTANSDVATNTWLPGARVDRRQHEAAFEGTHGDAGYVGAWLAPEGLIQFSPSSSLVESAYLTNYIPGTDSFGDPAGAPLAAGDRVDLAMANISYDAPLHWDDPRLPGAADGTVQWDHAVDARRVTARYGTRSGTMDVIVVRADLVARGGDVDARGGAVEAPPLVVDLPQLYPGQTLGGYHVSTFFPYTQYVADMEVRVLPGTGKAVILGSVRGYLPEARERTDSSGVKVRDWHIPLTAVLLVDHAASPVPPGPGLESRSVLRLPAGGVAVVGDGETHRRVELGPDETLLAGSGVPLGTVLPAPDAHDVDAPAGDVTAASSSRAEAEAAAAVDAGLSSPVELSLGLGQYRVTLDPDYRGQGVLALRGLRRGRTGTPYANVMSVPFIEVDGVPVKLDRSRLTDLRVTPYYEWVGITSTGYGGTTPLTATRTASGAAHQPGMVVDAVYDLGDDRYAFLEYRAGHDPGSPDVVSARALVRSIAGRGVAASPIQYVELPGAGPVTYRGEALSTEFSGDLDATDDSESLLVGDRELAATIVTAGRHGVVTVVRGAAPLVASPQPDPSAPLGDGPVGIYYSVPTGVRPRYGYTQLWARLGPDALPAATPVPIGTACGMPQVVDGDTADAPPGTDIRSAWLSSDAANLYATIKLDSLPAVAQSGTTSSWAFHWRGRHVTHYARAVLNDAGKWSFEFGHHNLDTSLPSYLKTEDVSGDVKTGPGGLVRIAIPRALLPQGDGELLRETSARSQITASGRVVPLDVAPDGASSVWGTGGDHRVGSCA